MKSLCFSGVLLLAFASLSDFSEPIGASVSYSEAGRFGGGCSKLQETSRGCGLGKAKYTSGDGNRKLGDNTNCNANCQGASDGGRCATATDVEDPVGPVE